MTGIYIYTKDPTQRSPPTRKLEREPEPRRENIASKAQFLGRTQPKVNIQYTNEFAGIPLVFTT